MKRRVVSLALASIMAVGSLAGVASAETGTTGSVKSNIPFINGYSDGTFRPALTVTRAEVAKMVATRAQLAGADSKFSDTKTHWANKYIGALADKGMIGGYPDGTFRPDGGLTRAEATKILVDANGGATDGAKASFPDAKDHWASKYIAKAAELGIVSGYPDGNFKPDAKVTREEAVAFVNRAYGRMDANIASNITDLKNPFKDINSGRWSEKLILAAALNFDYTVDANGKETIVNINASIEAVDVKVDKMAPTVSITTKDVVDGTNAKIEILDKDSKVVETKTAEIKSNAGSATFGTLPEGDYTAKVTVGSVSKTATFSTKVEGMVLENADTVEFPQGINWDRIGRDTNGVGPAGWAITPDYSYNPYMTLGFKVNGVLTNAEEMKAKGYDVKFTTKTPLLQSEEVFDITEGIEVLYANTTGKVDVRRTVVDGNAIGAAGTDLNPMSPDGGKIEYVVTLTKDGKEISSDYNKKAEVVDKSIRVTEIETDAPRVMALSSVSKVTIDKLLNESGINVRSFFIDSLFKRATSGNNLTSTQINDRVNESIKVESLNPDIVKISTKPSVPVDPAGAAPSSIGITAPVTIGPLSLGDTTKFTAAGKLAIEKGMTSFDVGAIGLGKADIKITVGTKEVVLPIQVTKTDNLQNIKFSTSNIVANRANQQATNGLGRHLVTVESKTENGELKDIDLTTDQVELGIEMDKVGETYNNSFKLLDKNGVDITPAAGQGNSIGQAELDASRVSRGIYEFYVQPTSGTNEGIGRFAAAKNISGTRKLLAETKVSVDNVDVETIKAELVSGSVTSTLGAPKISGTSAGEIVVEAVGYDASGNNLGRVNETKSGANLTLSVNGDIRGTGTTHLLGPGTAIEQENSDEGYFLLTTQEPKLEAATEAVFKVGDNTLQLLGNNMPIGSKLTTKLTDISPSIASVKPIGNSKVSIVRDTVGTDLKNATEMLDIEITADSKKVVNITNWNPVTRKFDTDKTLLYRGIKIEADGSIVAEYDVDVQSSLTTHTARVGEARITRAPKDDLNLAGTNGQFVSATTLPGASLLDGQRRISSSALTAGPVIAPAPVVGMSGSFTVTMVNSKTINAPIVPAVTIDYFY